MFAGASSSVHGSGFAQSAAAPNASSLEVTSPLKHFALLATRKTFRNPSSADDFTSVLAVMALLQVAPKEIPAQLSYLKVRRDAAKVTLSQTLDSLPFIVGTFRPSHLAVCARSLGILKMIHERAVSSIVQRAKAIVHQFHAHTHVASLMWGLTRLRRDAFELFTRLCEQSIGFLQTFSLESFAIMIQSLGSSDRAWRPTSPLVFSALQAEAVNRVPQFSDDMFYMFLKGCAGIRMQFTPMLQKVVMQSLLERQDAMPPHSFPEMLGFLARTGVPLRSYLPTYERAILTRLETLHASQLPAILQSFALARVQPSRELWGRFDSRCAELMHGWPLANLELLVLSMQELDIRPSDSLLREIQHLTVERIDEFTPSTLCLVLAAHIGSKGISPKFWRAMRARLTETLADFKLHQAPTVIEACASTNSLLSVMTEMRDRLLVAVDSYSDALRASRTSGAGVGARAGAAPTEQNSAASTAAEPPQVSFSARDFAVISFSLAMQTPLDGKSRELVQKTQLFLEDEKLCRGGYRALRTEVLWDYAWSLFAFEVPLPGALLQEMFSRTPDSFQRMSHEQTTRACEVLTFLELNLKPSSSSVNGTNTHQSISMVPHALAESIRSRHWNHAPDVTFSAFTDDVRRAIVKELKVRPVDYTCVKSGKIFLTFPSSRVALDCADLSQCVSVIDRGEVIKTGERNMRGSVFTRRRTLEVMGWQVLPIEFGWEYKSPDALARFLRMRLAGHMPEMAKKPPRRDSFAIVR